MRRLVVAALLGSLAFSACGGTSSRTLVAEFTNVGDLVGRANVQQSDAVVGTVKSIDLVQRGERDVARVTLQLDPNAHVTSNTRAIVRSTSLLGEKYVDLVTPPDDRSPELAEAAVVPTARTSKAPELEQAFSQLGAILQSGGLTDLGHLTSASAAILEGEADDVGRVLDGTANLVSSIRAEKDALASALADLAAASKTLAASTSTLDRTFDVQPDALGVIASQTKQLEDLIVQLDRLGKPLGDLTRAHERDTDSQVKSLLAIIPKLHEVRATLDKALREAPPFAKLFARAAPGDYVQLDILVEPPAAPVSAAARGETLTGILLGAAV